ncbi:MAG TPA: hypothetical protein VFV34_12750 [Blastocatellia bacterium]|nr:hypothetical protein [Blastocatellia bacterium]
MNVKIEDLATRKIKKLDGLVETVFAAVPAEHLRGFSKIVFVDSILEPRLSVSQRDNLPALYHPRIGGESAWGEVATSVILPKGKFYEKISARLALKPNVAQVILSLVAQHYHLTLAKGVKKTQLEPACRAYAEKYFGRWRESQGGWRMKLTKPFRPYLDKWAKKLSKKYKEELARKAAKK